MRVQALSTKMDWQDIGRQLLKLTYYNLIEWHIIPSKTLVHHSYING